MTPRPIQTGVDEAWLDYNGHVNDAAYAVIAAAANEAFCADLDLSEEYRRRTGRALFTARMTVEFRSEIPPGSVITVLRRLDRLGTSSITVTARIQAAQPGEDGRREDGPGEDGDGPAAAETEHVYVHVDSATNASTPFSPAQRRVLSALLGASF
jgi:acyl-CoA thioester hydrolase